MRTKTQVLEIEQGEIISNWSGKKLPTVSKMKLLLLAALAAVIVVSAKPPEDNQKVIVKTFTAIAQLRIPGGTVPQNICWTLTSLAGWQVLLIYFAGKILFCRELAGV